GTHCVLRNVAQGQLICQATITVWKPPAAGADFNTVAQAFKDATLKQPGWVPEKLVEEGLLPSDPQKRIYRLVASGKQDGAAVVQGFHLVQLPGGRTLAVTTLTRAEVYDKLQTRDVQLVNALEPVGP
ncbi:MAG: hypothetical protein ACRCZF_17075, partial [Gemmataceae bacterium]